MVVQIAVHAANLFPHPCLGRRLLCLLTTIRWWFLLRTIEGRDIRGRLQPRALYLRKLFVRSVIYV